MPPLTLATVLACASLLLAASGFSRDPWGRWAALALLALALLLDLAAAYRKSREPPADSAGRHHVTPPDDAE